MQDKYPKLTKIISAFKSVFILSKRRLLLQENANQRMPSWPIVTRWGTWIEFAAYVYAIKKDILDIIPTIAVDKPPCLDKLEKYMKDPALEKIPILCNL